MLISDPNNIIEACARVAQEACLVPPDGGSPSQDEVALCDSVASRIRALKIGADARSDLLKGTEPVDPALIEPFLTEMREKVIPDILRNMDARAEARWAAIYGSEQTMHNAWRKRAEEAEAELSALKNLK